MYTLVYLINKDLLYSTGNYSKFCDSQNGKRIRKSNSYMYIYIKLKLLREAH